MEPYEGPLNTDSGPYNLAYLSVFRPSVYPDNDIERIVCVIIMITGCLTVAGAAIASLSLIISLYMRPEETYRSRYRLMMKEMVRLLYQEKVLYGA